MKARSKIYGCSLQPVIPTAVWAVALFAWHQLWDNPRTPESPIRQTGSYLGPHYSNEQIKTYLGSANADATFYEQDDELCDEIAKLLDAGKVVGLFMAEWNLGRVHSADAR